MTALAALTGRSVLGTLRRRRSAVRDRRANRVLRLLQHHTAQGDRHRRHQLPAVHPAGHRRAGDDLHRDDDRRPGGTRSAERHGHSAAHTADHRAGAGDGADAVGVDPRAPAHWPPRSAVGYTFGFRMTGGSAATGAFVADRAAAVAGVVARRRCHGFGGRKRRGGRPDPAHPAAAAGDAVHGHRARRSVPGWLGPFVRNQPVSQIAETLRGPGRRASAARQPARQPGVVRGSAGRCSARSRCGMQRRHGESHDALRSSWRRRAGCRPGGCSSAGAANRWCWSSR